MKKLLLFLLVGILLVGTVNAFSATTFNNSLGVENLTFSGGENITRYLAIPSTVNTITTAQLNLSGFSTLCKQEQTNESFIGDGSCNQNFSGNYVNSSTGGVNSPSEYFDGNDTTSASLESGQTHSIIANYSFPLNNPTNVIWEVIGGGSSSSRINISIPSSCLDNGDNILSLETIRDSCPRDIINWSCYNGSQYIFLSGSGSCGVLSTQSLFEEKVYWGGLLFPTNISLEINGTPVYNFTGTFNQTNNRTSNFFSVINSFLSTCTLVGGFCNVPFDFFSLSPGILQYSNLFFSNEGFIENNQTFNSEVNETSFQTFILNITFDPNFFFSSSARLNYNGTEISALSTTSGPDTIFTASLDIPLIESSAESELRNFSWEVNLFDGTNVLQFNTTEQIQNVSRIHLEQCGGSFTTQTLNFTAFNERNLTRINPYRFDGTFDVWLGGGTVKRENNFSFSSTPEVNLCIVPDGTMFVDARIQYNDATNTTFDTRDYNFQNDTINGTQQNIPLFLLDQSSATTFILKVQDENLLPLTDHLILIQRFYPGENLFRTVQIARTDDNGKSIGFFETETTDYRFIIKHNGQTLLTTSQQKIFPETSPFTLTFTIGEDLGKPWKDLEQLPNLNFSLTFNKSSNLVTFTYEDTSGNLDLARLFVGQQNQSFSTSQTICNENLSLASGTITCDVGNLTGNATGSYFARAFITRGSVETLIASLPFIIETISTVVGTLGLFMGFFIILVSAFAFKFNEIAGIIMVNAAIIFTNLIGLVSFGLTFISGILAVSIIIIYLLEK